VFPSYPLNFFRDFVGIFHLVEDPQLQLRVQHYQKLILQNHGMVRMESYHLKKTLISQTLI
jgi:hypothetical protein